MRKKSKKNGKKKNSPSVANMNKTWASEDMPESSKKPALPMLPMDDSLELLSDSPSTSQSRTLAKEDFSKLSKNPALTVLPNSAVFSSDGPSTSQKALALLKPDELNDVNQKVKSLLGKCFQNKTEMVVNRRVLEEILSDTLGHFYSEEDKFKSIIEAKHLTEKCKTLETQQIKLNRQRYALEKQIGITKDVIAKLIYDKCSVQGLTPEMRRFLPTKLTKEVRSVGLQVCLDRPLFLSNPFITCNELIDILHAEGVLPSGESNTAMKDAANKEVLVKKNNEPSTSKDKRNTNSKAPPKKDNLSGIKSKISNGKKSVENSSGSNSNVIIRRMSTRKTKIDEVDNINSKSFVKEINIDIKNAKQVAKLKVDSKRYDNSHIVKDSSELKIKEEFMEDVIEILDDEDIQEMINDSKYNINVNDTKDNSECKIMEEVMEDIMEISDDEDIEEIITDSKDTINVNNKRDVAIQVNFNSSTNRNSCPKFNEASSSQGAGLLIKGLNSNKEDENIMFCHLPKLPPSPKYSRNVSKPPAPKLNIEKKSYDDGTLGIVLKWSFACKNPDNIVGYELFSYQEGSGEDTSNNWEKMGNIKALPLPMVCILTHLVFGKTYFFIIRAVDSKKKLGDFSAPAGCALSFKN